jgi:hypothetical protein
MRVWPLVIVIVAALVVLAELRREERTPVQTAPVKEFYERWYVGPDGTPRQRSTRRVQQPARTTARVMIS